LDSQSNLLVCRGLCSIEPGGRVEFGNHHSKSGGFNIPDGSPAAEVAFGQAGSHTVSVGN
jgi:hypothetical protein